MHPFISRPPTTIILMHYCMDERLYTITDVLPYLRRYGLVTSFTYAPLAYNAATSGERHRLLAYLDANHLNASLRGYYDDIYQASEIAFLFDTARLSYRDACYFVQEIAWFRYERWQC